ncbi:hypothetical protein HPMBJEAJ_00411 [Aeromonas phage avDM6]|nr:hypothetical protein HPMBJEAJ_00411 [Aeromonas phage avDM6]
MAIIKLVNYPVFAVNEFGEVVGGSYRGPQIIIECQSMVIGKIDNNGYTVKEIVDILAAKFDVEIIYLRSIESSFDGYKVSFGYHHDF